MPPLSDSQNRHEMIRAYAAAGFALFPVLVIAGEKIPAIKEWVNTPYNKDVSPIMLGNNFGVVLQSDDFVIDIDPRRFVEGSDSLAKLWADLQLPTPKTFITRTYSGGNHIHFKKPSGVDVVSSLEKDYPGIEIKTKGRFVVGAGSGNYEVVQGDPSNIGEIPEKLLTYCTRIVNKETLDLPLDQDSDITRYVEYLKLADPAIQGKGGDNQTYAVACMGRDHHLSEETTFLLMLEHFNPKCSPQWEEDHLRRKVFNAFSYAKSGSGNRSSSEILFSDLPLNVMTETKDNTPVVDLKFTSSLRKGKLDPTISNALNMFLLPGEQTAAKKNGLYKLLRYNLFSRKIEFTRRAEWQAIYQPYWSNNDDIMLKIYFSNVKHLDVSTSICYESALAAAMHYQYHPVQQWLNTLSWDGTPRLEKLFIDYAGASDTPYTRACGKIIMIGAVARIYEPGCKFDTMAVLEGSTGTQKSTFIKVLGGQWYGEISIHTGKIADTVAAMQGHWIIETPEMAFLRRAESDALKFFLSTSRDVVRFAYGRNTESVPRQSIFIGTINRDGDSGYLKDPTGNRRFLPIKTGVFNLTSLLEDRDQLFAEAVYRYHQKEPYFLHTQGLVKMAEVEQEERLNKDPWFDMIAEQVIKDGREYTTAEIALTAIGIGRSSLDTYVQNRIGGIMRKLGYANVPKRQDGELARRWVRTYGSRV